MVRDSGVRRESAWRARLAKFGRSDLTVAEFCQKEKVSQASFYHWRSRLERSVPEPDGRPGPRRPKGEKHGPFIPLSVSSLAVAEIEFPNGVRVRIPARDGEALQVVLRTGIDVCQEVR